MFKISFQKMDIFEEREDFRENGLFFQKCEYFFKMWIFFKN